jgi:ribosomal protein L11 methyltransferase
LELMEKYFDSRPPTMDCPLSIIDVGCGSGILSIAALKLGASAVLGVDIDETSIVNARQNADTNQIGEELILGVGSVQEILEGKFPFRRAPLVIANILAPVIVRLFNTGLAELVEKGGALILSGILQEQAQSVIDAAQAKGLEVGEQHQMGDWVALTVS